MNEPRSLELVPPTGLRHHLLEWESAARHTVVLVHGFLDGAWGWARVAPLLAPDFHVVAPDLRGHGDTAWAGPGGYYHFMDYVADLHGLVAGVARDRVSLVGHSMGGSVVAYFAGAYPERVHRLALLEGIGPPEDDGPLADRLRHWVAAWEAARARRPRGYASREEAALRLQERDARLDPSFARFLAERCTRQDEDGLFRFKHDPLHLTRGPYPFREATAREFWSRIRCPVLAVDAEGSEFAAMGEAAERRLSAFGRLARARLPDAGHMMQRHQPELLAKVLRDFLGAPDAAAEGRPGGPGEGAP